MDVFWGQGEDKETEELFFTQTVDAAVEAYNSRVPVRVSFGEGKEDRISFCRNYIKKDGSVTMNPGRREIPDIVKRASDIDYTLSVMRFEGCDGALIAEIVNFACHPDTVGGQEYCADYPGEMRKLLKDKYGESSVTVFLCGCSGNVNHIDYYLWQKVGGYPYGMGTHYAVMGKALAEKVLSMPGIRYCPHGRPVIAKLTRHELERLFGRV
jgi:hypothetical protein